MHPLEHTQIFDWLEGKLRAEETNLIAELVAESNEETQALVAWTRQFLAVTEQLQIGSLSTKTKDLIRDRFVTRTSNRRPPTFWQQINALLTYDSRQQMGVVGARQMISAMSSHQIIYESQIADIALTLKPVKEFNGWSVSGQIYMHEGVPDETFTLQLGQPDKEFAITYTDELGEFKFVAVPAGNYQVVVCGSSTEILIDPLILGNLTQI